MKPSVFETPEGTFTTTFERKTPPPRPPTERERIDALSREFQARQKRLHEQALAHIVLEPGLPPESCQVIWCDGEIVGWTHAMNPSAALQMTFYDWENPRYRAVQSTCCKHVDIYEAIEHGRITKKLRIVDAEITRLKKENAKLRDRIKELETKKRRKKT